MNRRDASLLITQHAAMIAHLDAIELRIANHLDRIDDAIGQVRADLANLKLEMATHQHGQDDE